MFERINKIRQKIDAAVNAALKAGQIAQQRADIALARLDDVFFYFYLIR
jgi:hypothetical protein